MRPHLRLSAWTMVIFSLKRSNYTLYNSLLQKTEKKFENLSNFFDISSNIV